MQSAIKSYISQLKDHIYGKILEISRPREEFRICFCGKTSSESVAWYLIDVSVEEACLSEKTESSTRKLTPILVAKHFPSVYYAALGGRIYSLGGQRRSEVGGETLLEDVLILDSKSLKKDWFSAVVENGISSGEEDSKSGSDKALRSEDWNSRSLAALTFADRVMARSTADYWKPGPPMTFARCNPHTMVVDHKLYVLGGFQPNQKQADGWIEVFDPEEEKWESLPSPPDQIHSSVMISGLLKDKKEIIIAKQRWDRDPMIFYSYNIMTRSWSEPLERKAKVHLPPNAGRAVTVGTKVHLPPNAGRAVTVGTTLYWISTEEHNHECIIRSYDLDRNMWFEDCLNTATIFGRREHFSSIYSSGPGFLHLRDQKFCLLLQSTVTKNDPQSPSIQYLYCVILQVSPIYEHEDRGKFELTTVSVQKYSMGHYINFLDCMLV